MHNCIRIIKPSLENVDSPGAHPSRHRCSNEFRLQSRLSRACGGPLPRFDAGFLCCPGHFLAVLFGLHFPHKIIISISRENRFPPLISQQQQKYTEKQQSISGRCEEKKEKVMHKGDRARDLANRELHLSTY